MRKPNRKRYLLQSADEVIKPLEQDCVPDIRPVKGKIECRIQLAEHKALCLSLGTDGIPQRFHELHFLFVGRRRVVEQEAVDCPSGHTIFAVVADLMRL